MRAVSRVTPQPATLAEAGVDKIELAGAVADAVVKST